MKRNSLMFVRKVLTSLFLLVYSFTPSVLAIDELNTIDNSQDILAEGISDPVWITNGSQATTSNVVKLNEKYVAPQDSDVTVTFSKLPTNPSKLTIKQITLSDEEVQATGAISKTAYDITTEMADGTFTFDLTLPSDGNDNEIVYAENRNDILNNNTQEVSNTIVNNNETIKVEDLNHFTIYIVTGSDAPKLSTALVDGQTSVTVPSSTDVTVSLNVRINGGSNWKSTKYQIEGSSATCSNTDNHSSSGTYEESFDITAPSAVGTYDLTLWAYNKDGCTGVASDPYVLANAITVKNGNPTLTPPTLSNNPSDTYALNSVSGIWTQILGGTNYQGINTTEIRWGVPDGAQKSGLKFTNSGLQSFNEGNTFYLGMLTHMNWLTRSGAASSAKLQITLDFARPDIANPVLTYDFAIEETSNLWGGCPSYQESATPCDDKITFPNSYGTQTFTIGDTIYTLVIDGFVNAFPAGNPLSAFITEEQENNYAFLVGHLSSVLVERPEIRITKKTNNQDITSAPGQTLYVGDPVTWQYIVQNSGNTTLSNIHVTDNPSENISCPKTELLKGETMTCTATGTVQAGQYSNTATVTSGTLSATDTSYYFGGAFCGDNVVNGNEQCDGTAGVPNSEFQCTNKCTLELVEEKVTICHASDSQTNPYVTNQPDKSGDVSGHDGHNGPIWYPTITTSWGDIIPPFYYIGGYYSGKNWTSEGQAIWNNGCNIPKGTLTVQKTTLPSGDTTTFNVNISGTGQVFNSISGTVSDTSDYKYSLAPGTYTVLEDIQSGWAQTSNTCTNVVIGNNDNKTCTIVNEKLPSITITKILNGNSIPLSTFKYQIDGGTEKSFENDGTNNEYLVPNSNYTISEVNPGNGYKVEYSEGCSGNLTYGASATCTITNTEYSSLTIVKDANPNSSQDFNFLTQGIGLSNFSLDDDSDSTLSNTKTFANLLPGKYSITETSEYGWDSTVSCTNGQSPDDLDISAGQDITCVFVNTQRGAIGGHKYDDKDGSYLTATDRLAVLGWSIELLQDGLSKGITQTGVDGSYAFTNLVNGTYQLREVLQVGWYRLYPTNEVLTVDLQPGENDFTNDFINIKSPSITVLKNVDTNADGVIDIVGATDWTWDLNGISNNNTTGSKVIVTNPGTYTISEDQKTNYHVTSLICGDTNYGAVESQSITLESGQDLVCTFTNTHDTGVVHVVKELVNDNGGTLLLPSNFGFKVDGGSEIQFENDGTNDIVVLSGLEYDITEPSTQGYETTYNNCENIQASQTCTITNDDIAPRLTLVKEVINDNGGLALASDWTLIANGPTTISGQGGVISDSTFLTGTYTLSESGRNGYSASNWVCDNHQDGNTVTLGLDESAVCTITNNDISPTVTLIKNVVNNYGGTANSNSFGLTVDGRDVSSTETVSVDANKNISLNETQVNGYEFVSIDGTGCPSRLGESISLNEGQNLLCTITNRDIAPVLTVVKHVVNNTNDNNLEADDFEITVSGTEVSTSSFPGSESGTTVTLDAGSYNITEEYDSNDYTQTTEGDCSGTINIGESKTCTIINTDIDHKPSLEVLKRASINTIPETGQDVTFTYSIKNISLENVTITSLADDVFGNLTGNNTCQIGTVLTPDSSCSFDETRTIVGDTTTNHTNTFVAQVEDDERNVVSANDSETVTFTNVNPSITVNKSADVPSVPETDGRVTYTFDIRNNTNENISITSLSDDKFGVLSGDSDCQIGTVLIGGASCSFAQAFDLPATTAPAIHTNTFTATVIDNEENTASANESESVVFDYVPTLKLVKEVVNSYNGSATPNDWILYANGDRYGFSNYGGEGTYHVVTAGQTYTLTEEGSYGYTASEWTCDKEGVLEGNIVTLSAEDDVTCTITNTAQPGTIIVRKEVENSEGMYEDVYSDTTFNVNLNDDLTNIKQIRDSQEDSLVATFTNLNAGQYSVTELPQDGYSFEGCYREYFEERVLMDEGSTFNLGNGETAYVVCTNRIIDPILEIAKSNDSEGTDLLAGDSVVYTLTITAPNRPQLLRTQKLLETYIPDESEDKYIVEDVKVVDLPPEGFKYEGGSWTATSSIRGDIKDLGITSEPQYHSPGVWSLGDMIEGEIVTLTYTANISEAQDAGLYKDLALARGIELSGGQVLANSNDGYFVDTSVNVIETLAAGQVLGATTYQYLPDTGADSTITLLILSIAGLGIVLLTLKSQKKVKVYTIVSICVLGSIAMIMPSKTYAQVEDNIAIQVEQPKTPNNNPNFKLGFVALDILGREIEVQCFETTHGLFETQNLKEGGNSGDCSVDSSVVTGTGDYEFYVIANAGGESKTSKKVIVSVDLNGPSPVVNYKKDINSCINTLSFSTANDGGQTSKIQIFRSTSQSFIANSTTLLHEKEITSDQTYSYTDTVPVCDQTYFYAVRALDKAGNTSTFVVDNDVKVLIEPAVQEEETITPINPITPTTPEEENTEDIQGEQTENNTDNQEDVKGAETTKEESTNIWSWLTYVLIGIGVVAVAGLGYTYARNRKKSI